MMNYRVSGCRLSITSLLVMLLFPPLVNAAQDAEASVDQSFLFDGFQFGLAAGWGQRSNPLVDGDDIDIYWLADIAWYGTRWFFDNGDIGYSFLQTDSATISLVGSVNSDRVFFSKLNDGFLATGSFDSLSPVANPPDPATPTAETPNSGEDSALDTYTRSEQAALIDSPDRDYAFELGVEFLLDGRWGFLQAQFNSDVSSVHNGHEFWVKLGYDWYKGRWQLQPSIGASWKSSEFNNYYFGVRGDEVTELLPAYSTGSGINTSASLSLRYLLGEHLSVVATLEYEKLNSGASNSPFIFEDSVNTVFAGLFYRF